MISKRQEEVFEWYVQASRDAMMKKHLDPIDLYKPIGKLIEWLSEQHGDPMQ